MSERERLADLARRAYWAEPTVSSDVAWLNVANAIIADRNEQNMLAVEHMEARIEAAEYERDRWKANYEKLVKNLSSIPPTREEPSGE
jgi:hypothetical protein